MTRSLAYLLTALLLLQVLGRELLVLEFAISQPGITARLCVNKARPARRCNGQCYLAKRLRLAESGPVSAPAGALAKLRFEGLAPGHFQLPAPGWIGPAAARRYMPAAVRHYAAAPLRGIFQPPA